MPKVRLPLLAKRVMAAAIWTVIWLIIFNIFGVVVVFMLDVFISRNSSIALFYAVWLVMGAFCGFINFNYGGALFFGGMKDWTDHPDAPDKGFLAFCITGVVLATVLILCRKYAWGGSGDVFVPDSQGLTMTYGFSMLIATGIAYRMLRR